MALNSRRSRQPGVTSGTRDGDTSGVKDMRRTIKTRECAGLAVAHSRAEVRFAEWHDAVHALRLDR